MDPKPRRQGMETLEHSMDPLLHLSFIRPSWASLPCRRWKELGAEGGVVPKMKAYDGDRCTTIRLYPCSCGHQRWCYQSPPPDVASRTINRRCHWWFVLGLKLLRQCCPNSSLRHRVHGEICRIQRLTAPSSNHLKGAPPPCHQAQIRGGTSLCVQALIPHNDCNSGA
jgi:hypothetical protein